MIRNIILVFQVRAATLLVRRFHINPQEVVVLSQYRAQCSEIQKALLLRGEKDINVSTVVSAQGKLWVFFLSDKQKFIYFQDSFFSIY